MDIVSQDFIDDLNALLGSSMTRVSFDELVGDTMLQVVSDVIAAIDPENKQTLKTSGENSEDLYVRWANFMRIVNYIPPNHDVFKERLMAGAPDVCSEFIAWILPQSEMLRKRVYLAQFLDAVDVPQAMMGDEAIVELMAQYQEAQEEFKSAHKAVEQIRQISAEPEAIKARIADLEEEEGALKNQVDKIRTRVQGVEGLTSMKAACQDIRRATASLSESEAQMVEQRRMLLETDQRIEAASRRLEETKNDLKGADNAETMIERLRAETARNRMIALELMPKDIESRQTIVANMISVLSRPSLSDEDLAATQARINGLQEDIRKAEAQANARASAVSNDKTPSGNGSDPLALFRQQATLVERKKEETGLRLTEAKAKLADVLGRKSQVAEKAAAVDHPKIPKTEAERAAFVSSVRKRKEMYENLKQQHKDIRAEYATLQRTEEVLKARLSQMEATLKEAEDRVGMSSEPVEGLVRTASGRVLGGTDSTDDLDDADLNNMNAKALTEYISRLDGRITAAKEALGPSIVARRDARAEMEELRAEYDESKAKYENTKAGITVEENKLKDEVTVYRDECRKEESKLHFLKLQAEIFEVSATRYDDASAGFKEAYTKAIHEAEKVNKQVRERQKAIRARLEPAQKQIKMFKNLESLLNMKLALAEQETVPVSTGHSMEGGGDRLVV